MSLPSFLAAPWKNSHPAYLGSSFAIRPAPEYASGEVLVSSLYRNVGFEEATEGGVPVMGRKFEKALRKDGASAASGSAITDETWRIVVNRVLESPKLPNQSSKPFLQLAPVVPDIALYSGSARRSGNSWPAGLLVSRMIAMGSDSRAEAEDLWQQLYFALSVGPYDDVWAQWLQSEFELRRPEPKQPWSATKLPEGPADELLSELSFPAKKFVRDLQAILAAKQGVTRAQWVSLLGATVRLGTVMHVLWLCDVHDRLWMLLRAMVFDDAAAPSESSFRSTVFPPSATYLSYGKPAVPVVKDFVNKYLSARLGLNLLLWQLGIDKDRHLNSVPALLQLVQEVQDKLPAVRAGGEFQNQLSRLQEQEARTLACKKGIGSNLIEFARHVLGQRQSATEVLRGYDQGYFLKKKGTHASAPWLVSFGPVSVLSVVHCCLHGRGGARSVHRLAEHLAAYGLHMSLDDLSKTELGTKLRLLGLVLDSPDAESGMLLVPPFQVRQAIVEQ